MKKGFLILVMTALCAVMVSARTLRLGVAPMDDGSLPEAPENLTPICNMTIADDSTSVTIEFIFPTLEYYPDNLYPASNWCQVKDFYPSVVPGTAGLPQRTLVFQIPVDATNITLTENFVQWQRFNDFEPTPARPILFEEQWENLETVPPITIFDDENDRTAATLTIGGSSQEYKEVYIHIEPFKYYGKEKGIGVCYHFSYTFSFDCEDTDTAGDDPERVIVGPVRSDAMEVLKSGLSNRPANYLVVTALPHREKFADYARWKKACGHDVRIMAKSRWTAKQIKDSIAQAYNDDRNLKYIILGGKYEEIPAATSTAYYNTGTKTRCLTDYPYACVGNEKERTFYTGRMLLNHDQELPIILTKMRNFYNNTLDNPDFYRQGAHVSHFYGDKAYHISEQGLYVKTCEDIRQHVMANGKTVHRLYSKDANATPLYWGNLCGHEVDIPEDLLYPVAYKWNATTDSILKYYDRGCFYFLYRGHGDTTRWKLPELTVADITRDRMDYHPVVFSITCLTGKFDEPNGFAKHLLTSNWGASAVFAATQASYTCLNDALALGMFKTIWPFPEYDTQTIERDFPTKLRLNQISSIRRLIKEDWLTLGNILYNGETYMSKGWYVGKLVNGINLEECIPAQKELYHVYGDPGLYMNTALPTEQTNVHLTYRKAIGSGTSTQYFVRVSVDSLSMIGFWNETTGMVKRFHNDKASVFVDANDKFHITILRHNKIPFTFDVANGVVKASGAYVNDVSTLAQPAIRSVKQTSPDSMDVEYSFGAEEDIDYIPEGTIYVRDFSNNVLATERINEANGSVTLSSPAITPGIYVVSLETALGEIQYHKILIK